MSVHNDFGKRAEDFTVEYLLKNNYSILERNWRTSHLEVDIIAKKDLLIVFIEVKARRTKNNIFEEVVSRRKQKNIISAAEKYLEQNDLDNELRFDVAFVYENRGVLAVEYVENAFYGTIE